jgi:ADP-ribosylglycohydrolase
MPEIANYEEQVYAGVLGKVIGVYMGRPFEGWQKRDIVAHWGLVDRYVAADRGLPLVVTDDDITGTFTFVRALEDSGRYADTPKDFFGKTWLNYLIEHKTILWWGGLGVATGHSAYLRLRSGIPSPRSGSIEVNGPVVAQQIGAQIFIDAFGLVAPGDPELAARLAEPATRVAYDGEAVNGARVVAAMISAACVEKETDKLLDVGVGVIPSDSLIAQVHRDVRRWSAEDGDWHKTYDRIAGQYGYERYGGYCPMIPNHAIMVMAWSYAPEDFRRAQAIINTAGWDTDCTAANVGTVMGIKVGLDGIDEDYDFRSPFADRILLPTAEGARLTSDCLEEALRVARMGRRIMGWPDLEAPKGGAWHHFCMPGSRHGYMVEPSDRGMPGTGAVHNVEGPKGGRMLEINFREVAPNHPVRISTPVFAEPDKTGYAVVGTPKLYPGQIVNLEATAGECSGSASIRLFARRLAGEDGGTVAGGAELVYGDSRDLSEGGGFTLAGEAFALTLEVPGERGFPVRDLGIEITGGPGASGRLLVDRVTYRGAPNLHIPDELPRTADGEVLGWVVDADRVIGKFPQDPQRMTYFGKDEGRGILITGTDDWTDYTISGRFTIACADAGGLVARYRGLQRFIALVKTRESLKLVLQHYGETVLAETACTWQAGELHDLALTVNGEEITGSVDGEEVLGGADDQLGCGGAGYFVETGLAGFRETSIVGPKDS